MPHADILDQREAWRTPLAGSLALHVGLIVLGFAYNTLGGRKVESWGSNVAGGGAVEVGSVKTIPLPGRKGRENPLANPTESQAPAPPPERVERRREPKPEPNAIALGREKPVREERPTTTRRNLPKWNDAPNQIYSAEGPATVSPMYQMRGGGAIGVGPGVFGERFGAYASLVIQRIAEKWQTAGLDPRAQQAPVIVNFEIRRDGSIANPVVMQRSGNYTLDSSTVRAIVTAAPFPPLPPQYNENSANVELRFRLK